MTTSKQSESIKFSSSDLLHLDYETRNWVKQKQDQNLSIVRSEIERQAFLKNEAFRNLRKALLESWELRQAAANNRGNKGKQTRQKKLHIKDMVKQSKDMNRKMWDVMAEIHCFSNNLLPAASDRHYKFLDVCCASGGFSQFILDTYPNAIGHGVTLPTEMGGFPMTTKQSERYWCQYTCIEEDPVSICYRDVNDKENTRNVFNQCDLVALDGSSISNEPFGRPSDGGEQAFFDRENRPAESGQEGNEDCPNQTATEKAEDDIEKAFGIKLATIRLFLCQVLIALRNIKHGGTLVFRSKLSLQFHMGQVILSILQLFDGGTYCVKARSAYSDRGVCHFVCKGFNMNKQLLAAQLELLEKITSPEIDAYSFEALFRCLAMLYKSKSTQSVSVLDELVALFETGWTIQTEALKRILQEKQVFKLNRDPFQNGIVGAQPKSRWEQDTTDSKLNQVTFYDAEISQHEHSQSAQYADETFYRYDQYVANNRPYNSYTQDIETTNFEYPVYQQRQSRQSNSYSPYYSLWNRSISDPQIVADLVDKRSTQRNLGVHQPGNGKGYQSNPRQYQNGMQRKTSQN